MSMLRLQLPQFPPRMSWWEAKRQVFQTCHSLNLVKTLPAILLIPVLQRSVSHMCSREQSFPGLCQTVRHSPSNAFGPWNLDYRLVSP